MYVAIGQKNRQWRGLRTLEEAGALGLHDHRLRFHPSPPVHTGAVRGDAMGEYFRFTEARRDLRRPVKHAQSIAVSLLLPVTRRERNRGTSSIPLASLERARSCPMRRWRVDDGLPIIDTQAGDVSAYFPRKSLHHAVRFSRDGSLSPASSESTSVSLSRSWAARSCDLRWGRSVSTSRSIESARVLASAPTSDKVSRRS